MAPKETQVFIHGQGNLRGGEHRRAGDGGGGPEENTNVRDNLQRKTIKK